MKNVKSNLIFGHDSAFNSIVKAALKYSALFLFVILSSSAFSAQTILNLDQCLEIGLKNNLKLRNKAIETLIAEAGVSRAEAIYDTHFIADAQHADTSIPEAGSFFAGHNKLTDVSASLQKNFSTGTKLDLTAGYSDYAIPGNEFIQIPPYHAALSLSVSQSLLRNSFGSLDRARVEYAEYGRIIAENILDRETDLLALNITEAYWDLYATHYNHEEGLLSLELAKELLKTNRIKEKDGLLEETDIIAAEALIETRNVEMLVLSNAMGNAADYLANLIQLPINERESVNFVFPDQLMDSDASFESYADGNVLYHAALTNRADVSALSQSIAQADTDIEVKKSGMKPKLELTGGVSRGDTDLEQNNSLALGETAWMVGVKFETSLSRSLEKSDLKISTLAQEKARNDLKSLKDAIYLECRSVARACQSSRERVLATARASKLQEKRLKLERAKFDQGRSDTRWVIGAQDDQVYMRILHHRALADYRKAQAGYLVVQGLAPVRSTE